MTSLNHPILEESFRIIDREIGPHSFSPSEYSIIRRIIHTTADFEYLHLFRHDHNAIDAGIEALIEGGLIITDVTMVKQGIKNLVAKTFGNPIISAVEQVNVAAEGKTLTETGLLRCFAHHPSAIYVIGNAPTALLALSQQITLSPVKPALVIGVPVGFVSVVESKEALTRLRVPQMLIEGRKGGSTVAAAIVNALIVLAWEKSQALQE